MSRKCTFVVGQDEMVVAQSKLVADGIPKREDYAHMLS